MSVLPRVCLGEVGSLFCALVPLRISLRHLRRTFCTPKHCLLCVFVLCLRLAALQFSQALQGSDVTWFDATYQGWDNSRSSQSVQEVDITCKIIQILCYEKKLYLENWEWMIYHVVSVYMLNEFNWPQPDHVWCHMDPTQPQPLNVWCHVDGVMSFVWSVMGNHALISLDTRGGKLIGQQEGWHSPC